MVLVLCQKILLLEPGSSLFMISEEPGSNRMERMDADNLASLKDDRIAFIEGHAMRHLPSTISGDTPRVWWDAPQGILFSHETAAGWYRDYREVADTVETLLDLARDLREDEVQT
jgi:hypothetical protein